jgi:hypothetical protein
MPFPTPIGLFAPSLGTNGSAGGWFVCAALASMPGHIKVTNDAAIISRRENLMEFIVEQCLPTDPRSLASGLSLGEVFFISKFDLHVSLLCCQIRDFGIYVRDDLRDYFEMLNPS